MISTIRWYMLLEPAFFILEVEACIRRAMAYVASKLVAATAPLKVPSIISNRCTSASFWVALASKRVSMAMSVKPRAMGNHCNLVSLVSINLVGPLTNFTNEEEQRKYNRPCCTSASMVTPPDLSTTSLSIIK